MRRKLEGRITYFRIEPPVGYGQYLERLNECDIHLGTFPFGGTNSNYDSMRLGIPLVALNGKEVHNLTDFAMLSAVGFGNELSRDSVDEYVRLATRLLDDDEYRVDVAQRLLNADIDANLIEHAEHRFTATAVEAIRVAHRHHETIRKSGVHFLTKTDWRGLIEEAEISS